ncbi:MAG: peptide-methionine (S)-S-oxide reductase MsrA [Candidatus Thermoplasmatota archaeon]|nr:peptide-methionine (S)-S-oxide reductase MsrA [Candidatus Thermoplasmatota archaeon]
MAGRIEEIYLGGGCFWCTEAVFQEVTGVIDVDSGYSGGSVENPSYEEVCSGRTGHAEVVRVRFDPEIITFRDILEIFFDTHDPTTLNRQGHDVGTQYRSVIFYMNSLQRDTAQSLINELNESGRFRKKIVTELEPFSKFYSSEDYHKNYYRENSYAPYCTFVISPKLEKFRKSRPMLLKR